MLSATLGCETWMTSSRPIDSDVELVRAVARGDKAAFERLFHLYHPRVHAFSIRMLQDAPTADEVACDTLYAVWTGAAAFREQSAVSSWILGIAYRRSLKSYHRTARHTDKREPAQAMDELAELSPHGNPEAHADNAQQVGQMQVALLGLSSDHRAVIELIALGYAVGEIAGIVGCPENTVKTRTFHARRQLRAALQE